MKNYYKITLLELLEAREAPEWEDDYTERNFFWEFENHVANYYGIRFTPVELYNSMRDEFAGLIREYHQHGEREKLNCFALDFCKAVYLEKLIAIRRAFQNKTLVDGPWLDEGGLIPITYPFHFNTPMSVVNDIFKEGCPLASRTLLSFLNGELNRYIREKTEHHLQSAVYEGIAADFKKRVHEQEDVIIEETAGDYFFEIARTILDESIEKFAQAKALFNQVAVAVGPEPELPF
jgi:hypothetical protein